MLVSCMIDAMCSLLLACFRTLRAAVRDRSALAREGFPEARAESTP
jgi:hypothetical protein